MSIDRASRFVVAWASGPREETLAETVVATTRQRTAGQVGIPYVSDGWKPYAETVGTTYRDREPSGIRPGWDILRPTEGIRLTQAVKHRKRRRLVRVEVRATIGEPVAQPYPVHIERLNGVLRDRLGCLTRKTHAFAKEVELWDALFSLTLFAHNWLRPHSALRRRLPQPVDGRRYDQRTPAMALGLTDHPLTWAEFMMTKGKVH
jgi:IS1 family transposase